MEDNDIFKDLEESSKQPTKKPKKKSPKKDSPSPKLLVPDSTRDLSIIEEELNKFEQKIEEIYTSLDSVNPLSIPEPEERLKTVKLKMDILDKLPKLLKALSDLRENAKNKAEDIRGAKELSPLESGLL